MKYMLIFLLLSFSSQLFASGLEQDDEACAKHYARVSQASGKLTAEQVNTFLNAIGCSYFSTAEGGEFGSELIMLVLENSPAEFISAYEKLNASLQEVIIAEIREPVHDGFNLKRIYQNVENVTGNSHTRTKILAALKQAATGQGIDIQ